MAVVTQTERWTSSGTQPARNRLTTLGYDAANRLVSESIQEAGEAAILTSYAYDAANNRASKSVTAGAGTVPSGVELGVWSYLYNNANQLTQMEKRLGEGQPVVAQVNYSYDANGNRISRVPAVIPATTASNTAAEIAKRTTTYGWDLFDRLLTVSQPVAGSTVKQTFNYSYDYRTRRTMVHQVAQGTVPVKYTAVVFSGGVSVAEYEKTVTTAPVGAGTTAASKAHVEYMRGPDMGGGVGGLLATFRNPVNTTNAVVTATVTNPIVARHNLSNGRGDIVAQSDASATLTWTASYEAYGKRTKETGQNKDKQRANTKDEDPTGLLNEGHRYRDIETGGWLSRDSAGFVDGPNLYAYVKQNPWTAWDPDGLCSWADPRSLPNCSPQMRVASAEQDRQTARSVSQSAGHVAYGVASLADGAVNAFVAVFGGPGKGSFNPSPIRRSLGMSPGMTVDRETYRTMQDATEAVVFTLSGASKNGTPTMPGRGPTSSGQVTNAKNQSLIKQFHDQNNYMVRMWYEQQAGKIDTSGPLSEAFARQVHGQRNALKRQARDMMSDRDEAAKLDKNFPIQDFDYYVNKYTKAGLKDDALWSKIIDKSAQPNKEVTKKVREKATESK